MGLTDTISRPVGPLPAWGWGVVVVGGYVGYHFLKGGSASSSNAPVAVSTPLDSAGGGSGGIGNDEILAAINNLNNTIANAKPPTQPGTVPPLPHPLPKPTPGHGGGIGVPPGGFKITPRMTYLLGRIRQEDRANKALRAAIAKMRLGGTTPAEAKKIAADYTAIRKNNADIAWLEKELGVATSEAASSSSSAHPVGILPGEGNPTAISAPSFQPKPILPVSGGVTILPVGAPVSINPVVRQSPVPISGTPAPGYAAPTPILPQHI